MRATLRSFAELRGEPRLVRVEASFLLFSVAELATWLAMLIYAFQQGGAAAAGVVAALQLLPAAALAPFASLLVDRYRRERVLLLGYLAQAAAMLLVGIALAARAPDAAVYGLAVLASCCMVLTRPANGAVLPDLCSTPGMLAAANGVAGTLESVGWLVGPAITGWSSP